MLCESGRRHLCGVGAALGCLWFVIVTCLLSLGQSAHAAINWTGNLDPADPTTWDDTTAAYVGHTSDGSVTVDSGDDLLSLHGYIAYASGYTGEVTVDGPDSTWTNGSNIKVGYAGDGILNITNGGAVSDYSAYIGGYFNGPIGATGAATVSGVNSTWIHAWDFYVGCSGNGSLDINDGGAVTVGGTTYVSYAAEYSGSINFNNGTLTTRTLSASPSDLAGQGTIDTHGLISDVDLVFDSTASKTQTIAFNNPPLQNITVNIDLNSESGDLGAGWRNNGSLTIENGIEVGSYYGALGFHSTSTGAAMVTGANSKWTNSSILYVGCYGSGTLDILDGGAVSNTIGYIGEYYGSSGEVTVNGTNSTWTNSSDLSVGYYGSGKLSITGGGIVSNDIGRIGDNSRSTGEVTVQGIGSKWKNDGDLYVGDSGSGTLNIYNGGTVSSRDGSIRRGDVVVNGVGSLWTNSAYLYVGDRNGTLNITGGGAVSNYRRGSIGSTSGSSGEVTVDGVGSRWTNQEDLFVGHLGNGSLNITAGGAVSVKEDTWVGYGDSSSGSIHFSNGTLSTGGLSCNFDDLSGTGIINTKGLVSDVNLLFDATHGLNKTININENPGQNITINLEVNGSGSMGAGYSGVGTMSISDGIVIKSQCGYIGRKSDSTGEVAVDGIGSAWTNREYLRVGDFGSGILNITDGGAVSNSWSRIGLNSGSTGVVTVDGAGSTWTNSSFLSIGYRGNGMLNITAGGAVSSRYGYISSISGSTGMVTVHGPGSTWTNRDELWVGDDDSGTLNITAGGLVKVYGTLTIDCNGSGNGYINMSTGGMLALFGNGDHYLGHFLAMVGGTDAIRYWDHSISDWANITGATYGRDYTLEYLTEGDLDGYTVLTVERAVDGDATLDGVVDENDAAVLADNWMTDGGAGWETGDFNGDGTVDEIDATILAANWQCGVDEVVPEPAAVCGLLGIGLAGLLGWGRFGQGK